MTLWRTFVIGYRKYIFLACEGTMTSMYDVFHFCLKRTYKTPKISSKALNSKIIKLFYLL